MLAQVGSSHMALPSQITPAEQCASGRAESGTAPGAKPDSRICHECGHVTICHRRCRRCGHWFCPNHWALVPRPLHTCVARESDTRGRNFFGVLNRQLDSAKQRAEMETGERSSSIGIRSKAYTPHPIYERIEIARDDVDEPSDVDEPKKKIPKKGKLSYNLEEGRASAAMRATARGYWSSAGMRANRREYNYIDWDSRPCPKPSVYSQADLVRQAIIEKHLENPEIYGPPGWLNDPNGHRPNPYLIE